MTTSVTPHSQRPNISKTAAAKSPGESIGPFSAGDHYGAGEWAETALANHGNHRKWRRSIDNIALTWQLAGEYEKALALWDRLASRRDALGRKARWFHAFSTYRLGRHEEALQAFVDIEQNDSQRKYAALYYQQKDSRNFRSEF